MDFAVENGLVEETFARGYNSKEDECFHKCLDSSGVDSMRCELMDGPPECASCSSKCANNFGSPCLTKTKLNQLNTDCSTDCDSCVGEPIMGKDQDGGSCVLGVKCKNVANSFSIKPSSERINNEFGESGKETEEEFKKENALETTKTVTGKVVMAEKNDGFFQKILNFLRR